MPLAKDIEKFYCIPYWDKKYEGPIFTFDLDKTYLATDFEQLSKLVKIPFEKAADKQNVPGTAPLVSELKKNKAPIFFISGSPKSMNRVIREKLKLDGVEFDGLLLKDYGAALKKLQIKKIIDKIGYKLSALLYGRIIFPKRAHEALFGDDSEYDATIYSLYSDIISGKLEDFEVLTILKRWKVNAQEFDLIRQYLALFRQTYKDPKFEVKRIFIHLETKTSPQDHMTLSDKVTPTYNYFQTAVILYNDSYINRHGLLRVIVNLIKKYNFNISHFIFSMQDLLNRGLVDKKDSKKLLTMICKGNPLALPLQMLTEVKTEAGRVLDTFTRAPKILAKKPLKLLDIFKGEKQGNEASSHDILKKYISHVPKRYV